MTNKIGEKIKELRKKADVTQEKFAEYLGITFQAVSRWESGVCYPDLETLPAIAYYFNVTTDELLGVDVINKQEKIDKIYEKLQENFSKGLIDDNIAVLRTAVQEFPNDYGLLSNLASYLGKRSDTMQEAISLNERILADCADDHTRYGVIKNLAIDYNNTGEKEKAIETAGKLPRIHITSDMLLRWIYDGDERIKQLTSNIAHFCDFITIDMTEYACAKYNDGKDTDGIQKRIALYKKSIAIYEIIYENGDYGFYNGRMKDLCLSLSQNYLLLSDFENALGYLEKAADYAITFDTFDVFTHTSMIFEGNIFSKSINLAKLYDYNDSYGILREHLPGERYDPIRETDRFKAVAAKLEQYAKKET